MSTFTNVINPTCIFSFGLSLSLFLILSIARIFLRSSTNFNRDTSRSKKFSMIFFLRKIIQLSVFIQTFSCCFGPYSGSYASFFEWNHTGATEKFTWPRWESSPRPLVHQSNALTTELRGLRIDLPRRSVVRTLDWSTRGGGFDSHRDQENFSLLIRCGCTRRSLQTFIFSLIFTRQTK